MKATGRWSFVSLIRFIVQFAWAVVLAITVITGGMFIAALATGTSLFPLGFPVYLGAGLYISDLRELFEPGTVVLQSFSGIRVSYFSFQELSASTVLLGLMQVGLLGYTLYALSVLKRPLNSMALNRVFEPENGKDLKTVSLLLLFAAPLKYGYEWLSRWNFESVIGTIELTLMAPSFDFTLLMAGFTCYVVAEIVNQAAIMQDEQKLTV